ncbi:peptidase family C78, partial [Necator americanus]
DVELVGNVCVDGEDAPLIGNGFTLTTNRTILEDADATTFLAQNDLLKHRTLTPDGLSLRIQVGFSCALRSGNESEDLRNNVEKFITGLDQLVFASVDKRLFLRRSMDEEAMEKQRQNFNDLSRSAIQYKDFAELNSYRGLASNNKDDSDDQKMVPIVRITRDGTKYSRLRKILDVTVPAVFGDAPSVLYDRLEEGLRRRISAMTDVMLLESASQGVVLPTVSHVFLPAGWSCFLHLETPLCCEANQHKSRGVLSTVKGDYTYYHYMQDGIDDAGWGCAYRSLQSIWSWYIHNGFTDKPVPTHLDIQKCLVEIKDKEEKFIGSRQWIGSTEIGFVLDHMLGIESRYIITNSGSEVPERARELMVHFQTVGSPVMIGGAQLAHTILGVDFDEDSGECSFLVLDPHYTGSEDLKTILSKGWCAWKSPSFWRTEHFYNMVLPQIPPNVL